MLDEILEYEEYSYDINDGEIREKYLKSGKSPAGRLSVRELENSLRGLYRALEISARHYIFTDGLTPKQSEKMLKKWLTDWLIPYVGHCVTEKNKGDRLIGQIKSVRGRATKSITDPSTAATFDYNRITYDSVVAGALEKGPLRRFALIENRDRMSEIMVESAPEKDTVQYVPLSERRAPTVEKSKDYILKLTAAWLLERRFIPKPCENRSWLTLTKIDVENWSTISVNGNRSFFIMGSDGIYHPIMEESKTRNRIKCLAADEWISNYSLLDITEEGALEKWAAKPENTGRRVYLDRGSGKPLAIYKISAD